MSTAELDFSILEKRLHMFYFATLDDLNNNR
jgi:hypothetical protein